MVLGIFLRVITQSLSAQCPGAAHVDKTALHIGAVAFIHRFGSSLNEHVHFHVCVVDAVLEEGAGDQASPPRGTPVAPTKQLVSVRYSPEVLEFFRASRAGWQTQTVPSPARGEGAKP